MLGELAASLGTDLERIRDQWILDSVDEMFPESPFLKILYTVIFVLLTPERMFFYYYSYFVLN